MDEINVYFDKGVMVIYKESAEQIAFFKWARNPLVLKKYPALELIYCNHNTQSLTKLQSYRWKNLGGCKGIPDCFLPVSKLYTGSERVYFVWCGLYIEFKAPDKKPKTERGKGGLSNEQIIIFERLKQQGYMVSVVYSANEAIKVVEEYLG